jgi:hypothetical protein
MAKARRSSLRAFSHSDQPACKPGSVRRDCSRVAAIPLGRLLPGASSSQPERRSEDESRLPDAAPIRLCSGWGLPCRRCCQQRGALLPHLFTLTAIQRPQAVCSLWHFPWGRPRRTLSGTLSPWSPDFPRCLRTAAARPTDGSYMGLWPRRVKKNGADIAARANSS